MESKHPIVIIGAGSGGLTVAVGLSRIGKKVLVVSENIGGDCTNFGCVPSKSLLHYSEKFSQGEVKRKDVLKLVHEDIKGFIEYDSTLLDNENITFKKGRANFIDSKTISVTNGNSIEEIEFEKLVIATGSSPIKILIKGIDNSKLQNNETIFNIEEIPESITIVGGGPIGVEMATAFATLGVDVTILVRSRLLSINPLKYTNIIKENLLKLGVKIIEEVASQYFHANSKKLVCLDKHNQVIAQINDSELYFIAIGRSANTRLSLEEAGIEYSKEGIIVNNNLHTSNSRVYAIGDCIVGPKFTHLANNHARFIVKSFTIPFQNRSYTPLPAVTFSNPAIASTGFTEETRYIKEFELDFDKSDRGQIDKIQDYKGSVFINSISGKIVGAVIIGRFSEHIINFFTLAVHRKVTIWSLSDLMIPYPTYFDSFGSLYSRFLLHFIKNIRNNVTMLLRDNINRILLGAFWILISVLILTYFNSRNFDILKMITETRELFIPPQGFLVFLLFYISRGFVLFPSTILSAFAGYIYDFRIAIILTIVASNVSSSIMYLFGKTIFYKSNRKASSTNRFIKEKGGYGVLILRLSHFPFDLLSILSGSLNVRYLDFILATFIGSIPGTFAIVSFGASVKRISDLNNFSFDMKYLIIGFASIILTIGIHFFIKRNNLYKLRKSRGIKYKAN